MSNPSPQPPNFWDHLLGIGPDGGTTTNASDVTYTPVASTVAVDRPIKTRRAHRTHLTPGNRITAFRPTETACAVCLATRPWPEAADTIIFGHATCEEHANQLRVYRTLDAVVTHLRMADR